MFVYEQRFNWGIHYKPILLSLLHFRYFHTGPVGVGKSTNVTINSLIDYTSTRILIMCQMKYSIFNFLYLFLCCILITGPYNGSVSSRHLLKHAVPQGSLLGTLSLIFTQAHYEEININNSNKKQINWVNFHRFL